VQRHWSFFPDKTYTPAYTHLIAPVEQSLDGRRTIHIYLLKSVTISRNYFFLGAVEVPMNELGAFL
jgi:hypothetical protein